jgi:multiple sugar transport system ATP-binding protein
VSAVEVKEIRKSFGATAVLHGVSLSIASGEFIALVGPSGCGKTTLMRIIAGLEAPTAGTVAIHGRDVTQVRAADRDVAMVFQNYALYPHLTVRQNLAVPLVMRRMTAWQRMPGIGRLVPGTTPIRAEIGEAITRTADMLGIAPYLERKPAQLSGGQRQRVALGRAIVRQPNVFLMDEPLSNLDAALRVTTRAEIVALHRRVGAATVYVTHDQSEAMTMSDRVAVMMGGEILQIGPPEEIYNDPQDIRVARFIGSPAINTVAAEIDGSGEVRVGAVRLGVHSAARGPITVAIRPEDCRPAEQGLTARVEHVEFLGESLLIHARVSGSENLMICRVPPTLRGEAKLGRAIQLALDPAKLMLFDGAGRRVPVLARAAETVR